MSTSHHIAAIDTQNCAIVYGSRFGREVIGNGIVIMDHRRRDPASTNKR